MYISHELRSFQGKAYFIRDRIAVSEARFPDVSKDPWILLDGTPATCSNIALHNLYPGQIDLVISGPNLGRNTSSAFALSS
jgi:5'/3'-nucleotidase SurE